MNYLVTDKNRKTRDLETNRTQKRRRFVHPWYTGRFHRLEQMNGMPFMPRRTPFYLRALDDERKWFGTPSMDIAPPE